MRNLLRALLGGMSVWLLVFTVSLISDDWLSLFGSAYSTFGAFSLLDGMVLLVWVLPLLLLKQRSFKRWVITGLIFGISAGFSLGYLGLFYNTDQDFLASWAIVATGFAFSWQGLILAFFPLRKKTGSAPIAQEIVLDH